MSSRGHRLAVESAREAGACVAQRAVRMTKGQAEVRELWSKEWRALGSPRETRRSHSFTCVGSVVYVIGGVDDRYRIPLGK